MKLIALAALLLVPCVSAFAAFRASATKVDITPDNPQWLMGYGARKSTSVHDRLYHRIVAMDDGKTQFYLISSDVGLFSPSLYDEVRARLHKEMGIDPKHVWWSATHTHSAPELGEPSMVSALLEKSRTDHEWDRDYMKRTVDALIGGVKQAKAKLEPAKLSVGTGISFANMNRRAKAPDGNVSLGMNPDGPADRMVGVIRFEKPDGSPIAVIANYAMHGTVLGNQSLVISGDAPGVVSSYLEQKLGAPALYVNGAAGNLAPIYSVYPSPGSGHLSQFSVLLGDRILAALQSLGPATSDVTLWADERFIETPKKAGLEWPEDIRSMLRTGKTGAEMVRLPAYFLRVNDTLIWSAPLELFCEIAIAVRNQSPFQKTFYFGYTNGWLGYLPTARAFQEGGYEPKTSPFTEAAERDLLQGVITHIQGMQHQ